MSTTHQPADALMDALRREHVPYELFPHRHTETALAEANALHEDPHQVAKTVILRTPFGHLRAVLRASIGSTSRRHGAPSARVRSSSRARRT